MAVLLQGKPESSFIMGQEEDKVQETSDLFMSYMKALEVNSEWDLKSNGKLKTYQMEVQGRIVVKGTTVLNLPFQTVYDFFSDPAYSRHLTNILDSINILYDESAVDRKMKVIQMVMKFPGPISNRQFLLAHTIKFENDNKVYMGSRSCLNYPFEKHKGTIMAMVYSSGFILQRLTEDKTKMTMISDYDSRGSIPNFIKRWVAGKSVNFLKNVEDKIRKLRENS